MPNKMRINTDGVKKFKTPAGFPKTALTFICHSEYYK